MKLFSLCKFLPPVSCGVLILFGPSSLMACGPDFPNSYLGLSDKDMLAAPEGYFAVEIERLAPSPRPTAKSVNQYGEQKALPELDDLRAALKARGLLEAQVDGLAADYIAYRAQQTVWLSNREKPKPGAVPVGLPAEFSLYLTGAQAWREGDVAEAKKQWLAVLALPAGERHYRATWAAYMLALSAGAGDAPDEAGCRFAEVRALAKAGFADSVNLVGETFGEEGRRALAKKDYVGAINAYLDQYATGDESAYASLRLVASAASKENAETLDRIAHDLRSRRVLTVWHLARFYSSFGEEMKPEPLQRWTKALLDAKIYNVEEADRLAWLAYEGGDFALAKTWAVLAPELTPETHWVRAKLALREGQMAQGAQELQIAGDNPALSPLYRATVTGELGRVLLALDRREEALKVWLEGDHWEDAAYVAEKVMTVDELKSFVENQCWVKRIVYEPYTGEIISPFFLKNEDAAISTRSWTGDRDLQPALKGLLARRLVRKGRTAEARIFFEAKNRDSLIAYERDVQRGFDPGLPAVVRGRAFWRAAQIARKDGMDLMGTELAPDFFIWGGSFAWHDPEVERFAIKEGVFTATADERGRLEKNQSPMKRFSYRYRAADLAWWAAALLPNDSDETAVILSTAGGWLKDRDPQAANPFYQALVIRCPGTGLGKIAAEKHWFP